MQSLQGALSEEKMIILQQSNETKNNKNIRTIFYDFPTEKMKGRRRFSLQADERSKIFIASRLRQLLQAIMSPFRLEWRHPMPEETPEAAQPEEEEGAVDPAQELHDAMRQRMMQNLDELPMV